MQADKFSARVLSAAISSKWIVMENSRVQWKTGEWERKRESVGDWRRTAPNSIAVPSCLVIAATAYIAPADRAMSISVVQLSLSVLITGYLMIASHL